ncbi:MAG TPA: pilin [Candidatus Paceibacterota bacterium]|nr:pilin [Candidatus Paceibacterota bacterium]
MKKILPFLALAAARLSQAEVVIQNPLKTDDLVTFIGQVLDTMIQIAMPFLVLYFIWVGFMFVAARGNPAEITNAKRAFFWAVVGAAVFLGAFLIATGIENTIDAIDTTS